jgi:hypothetical protein
MRLPNLYHLPSVALAILFAQNPEKVTLYSCVAKIQAVPSRVPQLRFPGWLRTLWLLPPAQLGPLTSHFPDCLSPSASHDRDADLAGSLDVGRGLQLLEIEQKNLPSTLTSTRGCGTHCQG